jgi:hypothetical protein
MPADAIVASNLNTVPMQATPGGPIEHVDKYAVRQAMDRGYSVATPEDVARNEAYSPLESASADFLGTIPGLQTAHIKAHEYLTGRIGEQAQFYREAPRAHPIAGLAGSALGYGLGAGALGGASLGAGGLRAAAEASPTLLRKVAASAAEQVVPGAVYGLGGAVDRAAIDGDPITWEKALAGAGWGAVTGGVLGGAMGAAGHVIGGVGRTGRAMASRTEQLAAHLGGPEVHAPGMSALIGAEDRAVIVGAGPAVEHEAERILTKEIPSRLSHADTIPAASEAATLHDPGLGKAIRAERAAEARAARSPTLGAIGEPTTRATGEATIVDAIHEAKTIVAEAERDVQKTLVEFDRAAKTHVDAAKGSAHGTPQGPPGMPTIDVQAAIGESLARRPKRPGFEPDARAAFEGFVRDIWHSGKPVGASGDVRLGVGLGETPPWLEKLMAAPEKVTLADAHKLSVSFRNAATASEGLAAKAAKRSTGGGFERLDKEMAAKAQEYRDVAGQIDQMVGKVAADGSKVAGVEASVRLQKALQTQTAARHVAGALERTAATGAPRETTGGDRMLRAAIGAAPWLLAGHPHLAIGKFLRSAFSEQLGAALGGMSARAVTSDALHGIAASVTSRIREGVARAVHGAAPLVAPIAVAAAHGASAHVAAEMTREKHKEKTEPLEKRYERGINDVASFLAQPELRLAETTKGLHGSPAQAGVSQKAVQIAQYLQAKRPAPIAIALLQPRLKPLPPSPGQMTKWLRSVDAAAAPLSILEGLETGNITPEGVDAVKSLYPGLYKEIRTELLAQIADRKKPLTSQEQAAFAAFLGEPVSAIDLPGAAFEIQEVYKQSAAKAQQAQQTGGAQQGARQRTVKLQSAAENAMTESQRLNGAT